MPVVRIIGRLNVGGPSIQALTLTRWLTPRGYATVLVRGREGASEGTMDQLADELSVVPLRFDSLRREFGVHDLVALIQTVRLLHRVRPAILHTHAAKAGSIGRVAALLLGPAAPPIRVHTFHGHVLTGYFGRRRSALFVAVERLLARGTTRLVAVSDEVRDDLIALRVAPAERISVIALGFDLEPFHPAEAVRRTQRDTVRTELGIGADEIVVCLVARLVAIKRVDRFLRIARFVHERLPDVRFMIVGDGELAHALHQSPDALALGDQVVWTGMRADMPSIYSASDLVALTSDNEGTPVSLIEAQAAGKPTIATAVGGVASVVVHGTTGLTVPCGDDAGFAQAIEVLVNDPERRVAMGHQGQMHVTQRFAVDRLLDDVDVLYRSLLERSGT